MGTLNPWDWALTLLLAVPYLWLLFTTIKDARILGFLVLFPFLSERLQIMTIACLLLLIVKLLRGDLTELLRRKLLPFKHRPRE